MTENYFAVIMAGGQGSRLWPLSRQSRPKQMLPLIERRTLFQIALQRLSGLFPPERILVVTGPDHAPQLMEQAPELKPENFLLEPEGRDTAPAIGLAAAALQARQPGAVMAVLTADHYIGDEDRFHQYLRAAYELAAQGNLVTLGIETEYGAPQYGYIQKGEMHSEVGGFPAFKVERFKEKPAAVEAERLHASGNYAWNSGMFIWQVAEVMGEFERQMPDLHAAIQRISSAWGGDQQAATLAQEWSGVPRQSIDYGIMEHAQDVLVIPAKDMQWNDVGNFPALFEVLEAARDQQGNLDLTDKHYKFGTTGSLVHSNGQNRIVVTVGVQDLVVVDTGDVLMICSAKNSQDIRQVIEFLKANDMEQYL